MKKLFFSVALAIAFLSCDNSEDRVAENKSVGSSISAKSVMSVGELHNYYLDNAYWYLRFGFSPTVWWSGGVDAENGVASFCVSRFPDSYMVPITSFYNVRDNDPVDFGLSQNAMDEIENLNTELDNAVINDIVEFQGFVRGYQPVYMTSPIEIELWNYYTDVYVHSFEYWSSNLEEWETLAINHGGHEVVYGTPCAGLATWWQRNKCRFGHYAGIDAGGALGDGLEQVGNQLSSGTSVNDLRIDTNKILQVGLGASIGAIIKDVF